jgi:opacity protein-like surface antigen
MGRLRTLVVATAVLAISGAGARAADVSGYPSLPMPLPSEKSLRVDELVSGWYLRGDTGYRFQKTGNAFDSTNDYSDKAIKDTYVFGVGVGYKAKWFRADLTGDYGWRSLFTGTNAAGTNSVTTKIDTFTVMGNGYLDLGTWAGITPYIGGGIGGAQLTSTKFTSVPPQLGIIPSTARWNLAWAAMAGVSVNITYNVLVDIGYRHIDMGDVTGGPSSNQLTIKKLTADEVRIGVRFILD